MNKIENEWDGHCWKKRVLVHSGRKTQKSAGRNSEIWERVNWKMQLNRWICPDMELWPPRNLEEHHFFQLWTASQQPLNISSSPLFSSSENCQKKDHHRRKLHLSSHICAIFLATTLFIRMQMAVHSFAGVSILSKAVSLWKWVSRSFLSILGWNH